MSYVTGLMSVIWATGVVLLWGRLLRTNMRSRQSKSNETKTKTEIGGRQQITGAFAPEAL